VGIPAFEKLETEWHWIWMTCKEREDQVREVAPDYVHVALQPVPDLKPWDPIDEIPGNSFLFARLDSDDAFLPAALDEAAEKEWAPNSWLDWYKGWRWDIRPEYERFGEAEFPPRWSGHFLAITHESREDMLNHGGDHSQMVHSARKRHRIDRPGFLQIIHGQNVGSGFGQPTLTSDRDKVLAEFNISANGVLKCRNV
jgi:hypothetical protein